MLIGCLQSDATGSQGPVRNGGPSSCRHARTPRSEHRARTICKTFTYPAMTHQRQCRQRRLRPCMPTHPAATHSSTHPTRPPAHPQVTRLAAVTIQNVSHAVDVARSLISATDTPEYLSPRDVISIVGRPVIWGHTGSLGHTHWSDVLSHMVGCRLVLHFPMC